MRQAKEYAHIRYAGKMNAPRAFPYLQDANWLVLTAFPLVQESFQQTGVL
jgi:hypothetical protein